MKVYSLSLSLTASPLVLITRGQTGGEGSNKRKSHSSKYLVTGSVILPVFYSAWMKPLKVKLDIKNSNLGESR